MKALIVGNRHSSWLVALGATMLLVCPASGAVLAGKALHWEPLYEPGSGGAITSLSVSPYDHNRVLVGGDMLGIGLSEDRGDRWQAVFGLTAYEIGDFTWHPAEKNTVWVATMMGPFVSTDGGRNWQSKRNGYSGLCTGRFRFNPQNPKHSAFLAADNGNFWQSRDGLQTWVWGGKGIPQWGGVHDVAFSDAAGDVMYLKMDGGTKKTTDGGKTWEPTSDKVQFGADLQVETPAGKSHSACRVTTKDGSVTYAVVRKGAQGTLYKKVNDGAWKAVREQEEMVAVAADPTDPNRVMFCTHCNPYRDVTGATGPWASDDGGQTWSQQIDGLGMLRGDLVVVNPHDPTQWIFGTNGRGYWVTTWPKGDRE